jgi:hypothetical protein
VFPESTRALGFYQVEGIDYELLLKIEMARDDLPGFLEPIGGINALDRSRLGVDSSHRSSWWAVKQFKWKLDREGKIELGSITNQEGLTSLNVLVVPANSDNVTVYIEFSRD